MGPPGSQLKFSEEGQDFFVLDSLSYKEKGYFVDIGAADGVTANNTFLLEKFYKWNGICVDPNPFFLQSLQNCRDVFVSNLCVYNETGKILPFKFCANENLFYGWNFRASLEKEIDVIDENIIKHFLKINVLTISLNNLLELFQSPLDIDYISIDVEGSEYAILENFDFVKYNVKCFTIENSKDIEKIKKLLLSHNYNFVESESKTESWYYKL